MGNRNKTAAQLKRQIRAQIERRFTGGGAGATKTQLRETLEHSLHPVLLTYALETAGLSLRTATADELHKLNYAVSWSRAWGKPLTEFYETEWGVDHGAAEQGQLAFAA